MPAWPRENRLCGLSHARPRSADGHVGLGRPSSSECPDFREAIRQLFRVRSCSHVRAPRPEPRRSFLPKLKVETLVKRLFLASAQSLDELGIAASR